MAEIKIVDENGVEKAQEPKSELKSENNISSPVLPELQEKAIFQVVGLDDSNEQSAYRHKAQTHHAELRRTNYRKYKILALKHYSHDTMKCLWCGIDDIRVLDLDHINDDGAKHRDEINYNLIFWIKKNNFPPMFQVLCRNCNWIKELNRREKKFEAKYTNEYKPLKKLSI